MSGLPYPQEVASAFTQPRFVLPSGRAAQASELAQARTPASQEWACLYSLDGQWYWRALGSPWLVATLEALCAWQRSGATEEALEEALQSLPLAPIKRYCLVMAQELRRDAAEALRSTA